MNLLNEDKEMEGNSPGFLDIEKAYDKVNRKGKPIIDIVRSMFKDTRAKYILGSLETEWVRSERGVKQRCMMTLTLLILYTEEIAARMRRMYAGVKVDGDKICLLLYAEDVVVMSETAEELQSLQDAVSGYWRDFGVRFSSDKSQIMIVNRSEDERDTVW